MILGDILISQEEINNRLCELARQIDTDYAGKQLVCIGILNGSFMFFSDLVKKISINTECGFIGSHSYNGLETTNNIIQTIPITIDINNKDVLIIEDIIDTGLSITNTDIFNVLYNMGAKSVKLCSLLSKPSKRIAFNFNIDYLGFEIPNVFVVGYGLDYLNLYRNIPCIRIIKKD